MNEKEEKEALEKEAKLLEQTDNGWQEGDPEEQPDNPEEPWTVEEA
jgi:hypothetical protein